MPKKKNHQSTFAIERKIKDEKSALFRNIFFVYADVWVYISVRCFLIFILFRTLHEADVPSSSLNRVADDISLEDLSSGTVPSLKIKGNN